MRTRRDEQLCLEARPHGVVLARPLAKALTLALLGAAVSLLGWPAVLASALLLTAAALIAVRAVWRWDGERLIITSERVVVLRGRLRRRAASVPVRTLDALELDQSLLGRLLGYGTLVAGPLEIEHVARPLEVCRMLEQLAA